MKNTLFDKIDEAIDSPAEVTPAQHDFDGLFSKIEGRIRRRTARVWLRAAAVVVPLVTAGAVWLLSEHGAPATESSATIAKADGRVRLVMPDGQEVFLGEQGRVAAGQVFDGDALVAQTAQAAQVDAQNADVVLEVPRGQRFDITLDDGTRVWLNSESRLSFPATFNKGERHVQLSGEACFEVARNEHHPFVVQTRDQQLRVLGTTFNVSAYDDEAQTVTTLVEGSIALSRRGQKEFLLTPNHQARLREGAFIIEEVDAGTVAAWRTGVFVFEGHTLEDVMCQLARWYDMEFDFADHAARSMVLHGMMPVQSDITSILEVFVASGGVEFATEGRNIIITKPK